MAARKASRALRHDLKRDRRMGLKRLLVLADGLATVPDESFNYSDVMYVGAKPPLEALEAGGGCGTVGCAIGWGPAFLPKHLAWRDTNLACGMRTSVRRAGTRRYDDYDQVAMEAFALTLDEANLLFTPRGYNSSGASPLDGDASPREVAEHIRRFATLELRKVA